MFSRVDHVELVPINSQRTIDFYTNVFGFKIKSRHEVKMHPMKEVIYLELGDTVLEVISVDNPEPKSVAEWEVGFRAIALEVEDMTEAVAYLEGKGIGMAWGPVDLGDSYRAEVRDPDGLIVELRHWKIVDLRSCGQASTEKFFEIMSNSFTARNRG